MKRKERGLEDSKNRSKDELLKILKSKMSILNCSKVQRYKIGK